MNDEDAGVRARTSEVLAEFRGADVLDSLIAAAADPAWEVRHSVAFALSRHGEPAGVPGLARPQPDRLAVGRRQAITSRDLKTRLRVWIANHLQIYGAAFKSWLKQPSREPEIHRTLTRR